MSGWVGFRQEYEHVIVVFVVFFRVSGVWTCCCLLQLSSWQRVVCEWVGGWTRNIKVSKVSKEGRVWGFGSNVTVSFEAEGGHRLGGRAGVVGVLNSCFFALFVVLITTDTNERGD